MSSQCTPQGKFVSVCVVENVGFAALMKEMKDEKEEEVKFFPCRFCFFIRKYNLFFTIWVNIRLIFYILAEIVHDRIRANV